MSDKSGGPAFPGNEYSDNEGVHGMALRDYFAAKAIPSILLVCQHDTNPEKLSLPEYFARRAYEIADAMLAERGRDE